MGFLLKIADRDTEAGFGMMQHVLMLLHQGPLVQSK
jgi:hypothetical protein